MHGHGQKGKDALVISCEFGSGDDANAWRKSSKEADNKKEFLLQLRK